MKKEKEKQNVNGKKVTLEDLKRSKMPLRQTMAMGKAPSRSKNGSIKN